MNKKSNKRKLEYNKKRYEENKQKILSKQKKNRCVDCNKKIHKVSKRCFGCFSLSKRTFERPYEIGQKVKKCNCGCNKYIIFKRSHIYNGIPSIICGHSKPSPRKCKGKIYNPRGCGYCKRGLSKAILRKRRVYCSEECKAEGSSISYKKSRAKQIIPLKDTKIEVKIQGYLKELGINFAIHQYIKDIKYGYQCDIFIPVQEGIDQKTVIECDGDYWHGNLEIYPLSKFNKRILSNRCIDYERTAQLKEAGFRIIRIWENKIKKMELNELQTILN